MILRGNLFLRMFLGFWLMSTIILGSWMLTSNYFESRPPGREWGDHKRPGPPHRFMLRTLYNLENLDGTVLATAVQAIRNKHDIQIYLVSRGGTDLLKRELPDEVARAAEKLGAERGTPVLHMPRSHLAAYRIYRPDEGAVAAVFIFPSHRGA